MMFPPLQRGCAHMEKLACAYVYAGPLRLEWECRWQTVSSHHRCGCYDLRGPTIKNLKRRLKAHEPSNGHTVKHEKPFFHLDRNASLTLLFSLLWRFKLRHPCLFSCFATSWSLSNEGEPESIKIRAVNHVQIFNWINYMIWHLINHINHIYQYLLRKNLIMKIKHQKTF